MNGWWMKIGLPVGLGIVAACINWAAVQSDLAAEDYIVVSKDLKAGDLFTPDVLQKLTIRRNEGSLKDTAIPYSDIAMLYNSPCGRNLKKGDLVFLRDAPMSRRDVFLKKDERAYQIDLENIKYEAGLLIVGNQIGFVIPLDRYGKVFVPPTYGALKSDMTDSSYHIDGPFRIVSVGMRVNAYGDAADGHQPAGSRIISIAVKPSPDGKLDETTSRVIEARQKNAIQGIILYPAN
jgi:hypothetical protein